MLSYFWTSTFVQMEIAHMTPETDEGDVISRIVRSIGTHQLIRAILLTSSRANPTAPCDILSDYDRCSVQISVRRLLTLYKPYPSTSGKIFFNTLGRFWH